MTTSRGIVLFARIQSNALWTAVDENRNEVPCPPKPHRVARQLIISRWVAHLQFENFGGLSQKIGHTGMPKSLQIFLIRDLTCFQKNVLEAEIGECVPNRNINKYVN